MSKPSTLRRVAALAAVPVALTAVPFAGVAQAAVSISVAALPVPGGKVGPNAGFSDPAQGVQGTTAVLRLTLSNDAAALQTVTVRLAGGSLSIFRDLAAGDGLALYKDLAPAGFGPEDKAAGPVSTEFRIGAPSGGETPVTITADPGKAVGTTDYVVTVHPATGDLPDRPFTLELPADSIVTNDPATTNEASPLVSLVIDSRAPSAPTLGNFTVAARNAGIEDGYTVTNENTEPDKFLAFLNSGTNVAPTNLLVRPDGTRTIHPAPPSGTTLPIGDGTGITRSSTVARNNQTSNAVFVRALDEVGNLNPPATSAAIALTGKDNDVTAPVYTTYTATVGPINASTHTAVAVTGSFGSGTGAARQEARLLLLDSAGNQTPHVTPWASAAVASGDSSKVVNVDSRPLGDAGSIIGQTRLYDAVENQSDTVTSGSVTKDLQPPRLLAVSPVADVAPAGASEGDTYRVFFSEKMKASSVLDTNGVRQNCASAVTVGAPQVSPADCVNKRLPLTAGPTSGTPSWGLDPATDWSADGSSLTITLGEVEPATPGQTRRLPTTGDVVSATSSVQDLVDNTVANTIAIADAGLLPSIAEVKDSFGLNVFGQGRDGLVDNILLNFNGNLQGVIGSRLTAAEENIRLLVNGTVLPVESATMFSASQILLRIPAVLGTGVPVTVLLSPGEDGSTGLHAATGLPVRPFAIGGTDRAAPAAISVTTRDSNANGRIDQMEVKYSEAVVHPLTSPADSGYVVTGYTNNPSQNPTHNSKTTDPARPDTIILTLKESTTDFDTEVIPVVRFTGNGGTYSDGVELIPPTGACDTVVPRNCLTSFEAKAGDGRIDGAGPAIIARRTADSDADGYLDQVAVQFSEALRTDTIPNGEFTLTDYAVVGVLPPATGSPDTALVNVAEKRTVLTKGDTGATPTLQYKGGVDGGIKDTAFGTQNPTKPEAAAVATTDTAPPAIVAATASFTGTGIGDGGKIRVFLSEAAAEIVAADFEVGQDEEAEPVAPKAAVVAADKLTVDLEIDPKIDPTKPATVELSGTRVIQDERNPANFSTQVSPVTAPPFPVVRLAPIGPGSSTPGFSTARTFATGAADNGSVVKWHLAVQEPGAAEPATPTADKFVAEAPTTVTVAGDGTYVLHLWGMDAFNNVSQKATAPVTVDSVGPRIGTPLVERLGGGITTSVRDNDKVRVRVPLLESDTGLRITADIRNLTGNPAHGAVTHFSRSGDTFLFPFVTVSGTTVYPVGTVLRPVGSNAVFVLEDGPGGTVVKRRYLSFQAMATHRVPWSQVINVPLAVLSPIPTGATKFYRDGQLVRADRSPAVYVITGGGKRLVPNRAVFESLRYSLASVLSVPAADLAKVPSGADLTGPTHPAGTYVRNAQSGAVWVVVTGPGNVDRLRRIVSSTALMSHVGWDQVVSLTPGHPTFGLALDGIERGLRDGMLVRHPNDPRVFVISRGARRHIDSRPVFELMGFNMRNVLLAPDVHVGVQPLGLPVGNRRVPYSVTASDAAGNTHVVPTSVVGLGIPEAPPATGVDAPRP